MGNQTDPATLGTCFEVGEDLKSSFDGLVSELAKSLEIERASLSWIEGDEAIIAALWTRDDSDLSVGLSVPLAGRYAGLTVNQGTSRLDHPGGEPRLRSIIHPRLVRRGSYINVPFLFQGQIYALLTVYGGITRPFSEADKTQVEETARQVNPGLSSFRFREKEHSRFLTLEREQRERLLFINSVAHELKTPLTAITASAGLLQEELPPNTHDPERRLVDNIISAATRLGARLEELLSAARSEKVGFTLKLELVDLRYLLQSMARVVQPLLERKNQVLTLDLPERVPLVKGDRQRLEQVVLNLLNNANKFTPLNGHISLRLHEEKQRLLVEVADNGPGIPPEDQTHLFQPYYRREADRDRYQGLGLGLAICKQLVEQHGGRIWVTSHAGEGSTFIFSLPLDRERQPEPTDQPGEKA